MMFSHNNDDHNNGCDYRRIHATAAPESMTMDRLEELDELVVAQTTQMCYRKGCCTPSINWVLLDASNYEVPDTFGTTINNNNSSSNNPFELPSVGGWIHEESTFFQRCLCHLPGCRETRFVHHAGLPPASLGAEDFHCCRIQTTPHSSFLTPHEVSSNIVAVHEKANTCPTNCCCCDGGGGDVPEGGRCLPYLRTTDGTGRYLGETRYVCDGCVFVPKFLVLDRHRTPRYLLRPDTCWGGVCVRPRCGGQQGKCCRLPFLVRDPLTKEPIAAGGRTADGETNAQVTQLWSGLANEVCFRRHAYHVAFPNSSGSSSSSSSSSCEASDKLVLIGSAILLDVALFEKNDDK